METITLVVTSDPGFDISNIKLDPEFNVEVKQQTKDMGIIVTTIAISVATSMVAGMANRVGGDLYEYLKHKILGDTRVRTVQAA